MKREPMAVETCVIRVLRAATVAILFGALIGCAHKHRTVSQRPAPTPMGAPMRGHVPSPALPVGYSEEGIASWYGIPYHGRAAADGEIYDMETLVAAHRLMPFNTWLRVTNLNNGKTVTVRVIDRGPFVGNRIIDLSKAAARQIDLLGPGTARVRLEVIAAPPDIPANDYYAVQIGAFAVRDNAERLRQQYAERFGSAEIMEKQGATPLWRVLVGKQPTLAGAQQVANQLSAPDRPAFVVRLDAVPASADTAQPTP